MHFCIHVAHRRHLFEAKIKYKSEARKNSDPSLIISVLSLNWKQTFIALQIKNETVVLQFIESFSIQLLSTLRKADLAVAQMNVYRIAP